MLKKIQQLSKKPFVRNVITLATGTAAAQAITLAFTPVITRLYGAEAFGVQGIFMSIAGALTMIAALTYPLAIILPKSDASARTLTRVSIYTGLAVTLFTTLVLWAYGSSILKIMNAEAIDSYIFLIPIFMLFSVFTDILNKWLIRKEAFNICAKISIYQAIALNAIKTSTAFIQPTAGALIAANTIGKLIQAGLLLLGFQKYRHKKNSHNNNGASENAPKLLVTARLYGDFPLLRAPQVLLSTAAQTLPIVMLAALFGPKSVAYYALANSVLAMPAGLIGDSVIQVFYPKANEAHQKGEILDKLIIKATLGMSIIGIVPFLIITIYGPSLFEIIFGAGWEKGGIYAQLLCAWIFLGFISRPAITAIPILHIQKSFLIFEVFSTLAKFIAIFLGNYFLKSEEATIAIFSAVGATSYLCLMIWVLITARNNKTQSRDIVKTNI